MLLLLLMQNVFGGSGGVVTSLYFCPASLKFLGCFYVRCVLSSQWKAVTVNLCESRGGRPGLSVLTSFMVSVDAKHH